MKAVIMAGGEGRRLHPMSLGMPKPMTPLFDRPVMEHIIALLRRHGITEIAVTLHYLPQMIRDHFEDGGRFGVSLTYFTEETPLGTAGGVKNCEEFLGGEDFLVLSGDSVCDLDLTAAINFHRERKAQATLLLYRHPKPLEYGLVLTDERGRIERFVEKPSWGQVVADTVNTGVYVLSPKVLERIGKGEKKDFAADVFPAMLERDAPLYGCTVPGYWCDMGDCQAYLDCVRDALEGKVQLDMGAEQRAPGIWSDQPLPEGVTLLSPCWIGAGVQIGSGTLIGPHTVLGRGSRVGSRCLVQKSVLLGAQADDRVTLYGAILCRGAHAGDETVLNEGAVLGENTLVRPGAVLMERVRLWPGQAVQEGCRLRYSLTEPDRGGAVSFGDGGVIRGTLGGEIDARQMLALGAVLGERGKVAVGCWGGAGAQMLLRAAVSGITSAGGMALTHDMECAAQAAWLGENYALPVSLFIEQNGQRVYLHLFDEWGLPLRRSAQRKIEHALLQGRLPSAQGGRIGTCEHLPTGVGDYAAAAATRTAVRRTVPHTVRAAVDRSTPENRAVRAALEAMGCQLTDKWEKGIPAFFADHGGLRLTARDESGATLSDQQLLTAAALVEMENGGGRLAVPDDATAALDLVAAGFGATVLRLGRDGEAARELYRDLPWLRDAAFAAARLCARMAASGERLEQLCAKTPRFASWKREVPLRRDRGEIMHELVERNGRENAGGDGLRLRVRGGWVYFVPLSRRSALRVIAEGPDLEAAAELCDFYAGQVGKLDHGPRGKTTK